MLEATSTPNEPDPILTREMNSHITSFLNSTATWEKSSRRIPVTRPNLPEQVRAEMAVWHYQMFVDSSALAQAGQEVHVILGESDEEDDVVAIDFRLGEQGGTVYETKGEIAIFYSLPEGSAMGPDDICKTLQRFVKLSIVGEHVWELRTRAEADQATAFSTNPRQSIYHAPSWQRRMDAGIFAGRLYVLLYKRKGQLIGLDGGRWFDDTFRLRVSARPSDRK